MIWKIWKKSKLKSEKIQQYGRQVSLKSEKIWEIQKKGKLNSEMIWKIRKKSRLLSEMIWKIWKKNKSNSEKVITKLPNSEQSSKGKVKTHRYINRQNQSTTGKL
jgi:hypothetical protein